MRVSAILASCLASCASPPPERPAPPAAGPSPWETAPIDGRIHDLFDGDGYRVEVLAPAELAGGASASVRVSVTPWPGHDLDEPVVPAGHEEVHVTRVDDAVIFEIPFTMPAEYAGKEGTLLQPQNLQFMLDGTTTTAHVSWAIDVAPAVLAPTSVNARAVGEARVIWSAPAFLAPGEEGELAVQTLRVGRAPTTVRLLFGPMPNERSATFTATVPLDGLGAIPLEWHVLAPHPAGSLSFAAGTRTCPCRWHGR